MRIIKTPYYLQCRARRLQRKLHGFAGGIILVCAALAVFHGFTTTHCKPSVHVARVLEVYPLGEHAHEYVKTYDNCKGD